MLELLFIFTCSSKDRGCFRSSNLPIMWWKIDGVLQCETPHFSPSMQEINNYAIIHRKTSKGQPILGCSE